MFDGQSGGLGSEPDVEVQTGAYRGAKLPLLTSDGDVTVTAYEVQRGSSAAVRVRATDFGNYSTEQSFTVRVLVSVMEATAGFTACGLVGHTDGTTGWKLELNASGLAVATLKGATSTKTVTSTFGQGITGTRWYAISYDHVADLLRVHSDGGSNSVSTVGMGEIATAGVNMYIGGTASGADTFTGFIRAEVWNEAVSQANLASMWSHGETAAVVPGSLTAYGPQGGGTVACVTGENDDGVVVGWFGAGQIPFVWNVTHQRRGMGCSRAHVNLANWDLTLASIRTATTCTETPNADHGPDGRLRASLLTGTSSTHMEVQAGTLAAVATVNVVFFARADVAHTMRVALVTAGGAVQQTIDVAVTTLWRRYNVTFNSWGGGAAAARVRFIPSNDGTSRSVHVSGPWFVDQDTIGLPSLLHVSGTNASTYFESEGFGLEEQYASEGEAKVEVTSESATPTSGTVFNLTNGVNSNDRRMLTVSGATAVFDHYDGAGLTVASESTGLTWTDVQTLRCRWQQLGLLEAASAFAGIYWGAGSDYDRTTTWTPGTGNHDLIQIGNVAGSSLFDGVVYSITLQARERIL